MKQTFRTFLALAVAGFALPAFAQEPTTTDVGTLDNETAAGLQAYRDLVERWKDADPELQPRLAAARKRLAELTPVERPRR